MLIIKDGKIYDRKIYIKINAEDKKDLYNKFDDVNDYIKKEYQKEIEKSIKQFNLYLSKIKI